MPAQVLMSVREFSAKQNTGQPRDDSLKNLYPVASRITTRRPNNKLGSKPSVRLAKLSTAGPNDRKTPVTRIQTGLVITRMSSMQVRDI
jgi:hypothetical protein